jgi:hypothetical protein
VVFVPLSTAREQIVGRSTVKTRSVGMITVKIADGDKIDEGIEEVRDILRFQHRLRAGQPDDFRINNVAEMLNLQEESSAAMTRLLAAIASISLIVGGIGIMNIMLVSVTERTREIGLRMAIGATRRNILAQFLVEAVVAEPARRPRRRLLLGVRRPLGGADHVPRAGRRPSRARRFGAGGRPSRRHRRVLRLLPRAQGRAARPHRRAQVRIAPRRAGPVIRP